MRTPNQFCKILQERIANYERQIEMSENSIISCNWVMVVNSVYTVGTDENSRTILSKDHYPTQFSENSAKSIENDCKFYDKNGNVLKAKRVDYREWYVSQIRELEEVISTIQ